MEGYQQGSCQLAAAELLAWRRQQLQRGGEPAAFDWLLDLGGGLGLAELRLLSLRPEQPVRLRQSLQQLEGLWQRHLRGHEPLQYLVGRCPWRDLELQVAPGVLIPRPETEVLADLALGQGPPSADQCWADLGTGSGCLALALARAWPHSAGLAVDLDASALALAGANLAAAGLTVAVQLLQGSWWEPLRPWWGRLALVVANPPYIPTAVWAGLDPVVRCHEPVLALDGGGDGLEAIRTIVEAATLALAPAGVLMLEHHHDQSARVLELLGQAGLQQPRAHTDLNGHRRFASARRVPLCS